MTMVTGTIPPPGIKRQPHLAGRLLGDHKDHSSSTTITAMAQSADPSASSTTNLFPTTTAGRGDSVAGPGSANVYYLVFLGVLVIILLLAACLAFRAFRMRRRYRTATQLAIARGDPLPMQLRDDYWGLAGLPGFGSGSDGQAGAGGVITGDRGGKKGRWERVPKLEEVETMGQAEERTEELFEDITPVTLHSLLALPDKAALEAESHAQAQASEPSAYASGSNTSRSRRFNLSQFRRLGTPSSLTSPDTLEHGQKPSKPNKVKEINREIQQGEDMRLAVVIQMPVRDQGDGVKKRQSWTSDEEEEEVAWETGMELGVWEGVVGR